MKRVILVLAIVGLWAVPAWANHSQSTGINCSNFTFQEDAQAYFDAHPGDPEGLDGPIGAAFSGIQNVACEDLPRRGSSVTTTTSTTAPATTTTTTVVTTTTTAPVATAVGGSTGSGGAGGAGAPGADGAAGASGGSVPATASQGRVIALTG
jgi:hypothetical protein